MKWYFKTHNGYDDIEQSSSAEAFSGHAVRDLATALVREGVQNSLDAAADPSQAVLVRLTLGTCGGDPREVNGRWFGGLMPHLHQEDVGAPEPPRHDQACRYFLFEDFYTVGLTGHFHAPYSPGSVNNFVNFMYHDGVTGKSDRKLGSRGVGKIVFTMASRARTVFACTIPQAAADARPLLVGKNLLKFREVDGQLFGSRAYFLKEWPVDGPREPVQDPAAIRAFRGDFRLTRTQEPGLSLVVPFLDESVEAKDLRRAIVTEYHYAILAGRLVVELNVEGSLERFTASHLPELEDAEVNERVALARWAVSVEGGRLETQPPPAGRPQRLDESLVPEAVRVQVAQALDRGERVAVRLPLYIHPKAAQPVLTHVDLYIEFAQRHQGRPDFVREMLPVSDVREARSAPQVRALVVAEPGPLADLLRAAEGANHTDWSPRTEKFKETYTGRLSEIQFVATAAGRLVEIVRGQADEPVGGISTMFFSREDPDATRRTKGKRRQTQGAEPEPKFEGTDSDPPDAGYEVDQTADGFTIRHRTGQPLPGRITARMAYDVQRGSPWPQYDPDDFDLRKKRSHVRTLISGAQVSRDDPGNRLVIQPTDEGFEIVVTGFDPHRDLIVDHRDTSRGTRKREEVHNVREADQLHQPPEADA